MDDLVGLIAGASPDRGEDILVVVRNRVVQAVTLQEELVQADEELAQHLVDVDGDADSAPPGAGEAGRGGCGDRGGRA